MTTAGWPPQDDYPIEEWGDEELIDQYRSIKAQFAGEESNYLDTDEDVGDLIQEIIRRGLDGLAEAVEDDPTSAGLEPG
jgi:hypothetical protein